MKSTGIVRRIDELGRVVIPKEIRKTLRIKEGDPLEIFTQEEQLLFKKYSPVANINALAEDVAVSLASVNECSCIICDMEKIVACKGTGTKELKGKKISSKLEKLIYERKNYICSDESCSPIDLSSDGGGKYPCQIIMPIISGGDVFGGIILGSNLQLGSAEIKSVRGFSEYIGRFLQVWLEKKKRL